MKWNGAPTLNKNSKTNGNGGDNCFQQSIAIFQKSYHKTFNNENSISVLNSKQSIVYLYRYTYE